MSDQNIYFTLCVYFGEVQQAHMAHIRKKVHQAGANAAFFNIFLRIYVQKPYTYGEVGTQTAWHVNEGAKRFATQWAKPWPIICIFMEMWLQPHASYLAATIYFYFKALYFITIICAHTFAMPNNRLISCALLTAITS